MTDHDIAAADLAYVGALRGQIADLEALTRTQRGEITDLTAASQLFSAAVADRDDRIAALETRLGQAYTDLAAREERETDLLVALSKAREERDQWRTAASIFQQADRED